MTSALEKLVAVAGLAQVHTFNMNTSSSCHKLCLLLAACNCVTNTSYNEYSHCALQRAAPAVSSSAGSDNEQEEERQHFAEIGDSTPRDLRYHITHLCLKYRRNPEENLKFHRYTDCSKQYGVSADCSAVCCCSCCCSCCYSVV
jgi:hypothetical protein